MTRLILPFLVSFLFATPALAGDWSAWTEVEEIQVVTQQPDGAERATTIWVVVVDGTAFIRTSESSAWGDEVEAATSIGVVGGGETRTVTPTAVPHGAEYDAVTDAFRDKYGFQDALIGWVRGDARIWSVDDAS